MEREDAAYLAMLNSKTINPPPSAKRDREPQTSAHAGQTAKAFPALTAARDQITAESKELSLVSETDAPFEWVSADWSSNALPTLQQLVELGWTDGRVTETTKSVDEFFQRLTRGDDPYGQAARFQSLYEILQRVFEGQDTRVYMLDDDGSITVLIVGIITDGTNRALAGLRSLLVET